MRQNNKIYRKNWIGLLFGVALSGSLQSQDSTSVYSKEISFKTENDAYLFQLKDAYYTNGFFLNYQWTPKGAKQKIIQGVELSQQIFTPLNRTAQVPEGIDRPYCGYLYAQYHNTRFSNKAIVRFTGTLGVIGKASGGEWMQNWYHDLLGFSKFKGWQYQISNAVGVNAGVTYAYTLYDKNRLKIIPHITANLGTIYTNAKLGGTLVLGLFEKNENSALWNARIDNKKVVRNRNHELFFYWQPFFMAQTYNATILGGLGTKSTTQVTAAIAPIMFQQAWGLCYAQARWTTRLELVYQSKETPSQTNPQRYGVIQLCYRMH
ncbi:MAG: lipid A deacylase LpxR family protein [Sediminibacterium sp.]|nr:lipid A deacylase LpxR family protein [Sediminibacterium sp.]MBX9780451.1 lipid A deacylase LpxR family protein [Chitinophagaceae bacterium]